MHKMMTVLTMATMLAVSAGGAHASAAMRAPAPADATQAATLVQYHGDYGDYRMHRAWRHEMWRRHVMHERWRHWHALRSGPYGY